jgi:hypothetical protein
MFVKEERIIALIIAWALVIGVAVASWGMAGFLADEAKAERAASTEIQQPVPEALLPPVTPGGGSYRM